MGDRKRISVAIPASVVSDMPHLREKTTKVGTIGRAVAIFRVDEVIIYPDNLKANQAAETSLLTTLLTYMETPQYMRKQLFKLKPELKYAGILPPLRTPHHPLNRRIENLKVGEFREGVTLALTKEGTLVDIGVERPALISDLRLQSGKRVTIKIKRIDKQVEVELADRDEILAYWGYAVSTDKRSFGKIMQSKGFDLTVATSRYAPLFPDVVQKIDEKWKSAMRILVAFGAPTRGLHEIAMAEGFDLESAVDFVVNTIPTQGTETVRTEEALVASLAVFNAHFSL